MHYQFDKVKLLRVVDGDTYDFEVDLGFNVVIRERFRLKGIDTPEIFRPYNDSELKHGQGAKQYAESALKAAEGSIVLHSHKAGLYGRWEADIFLSGVSFADMLEDAGYAKLALEEYEKNQEKYNAVRSEPTEES